jgi:hypothetical protein
VTGFPGLGVLRRLRPAAHHQSAMTPTRRTPGRDAGREDAQQFPRSHDFRSTRAAPSYTPVTPTTTSQLISPSADAHPWPGQPPDARFSKSHGRASRTDPYPPGSGSAPPNEASNTGSSRMPSRLAHHAHNPSGSTGSPWLCQGRLPPNLPIPNRFGYPQLHSDHCDNPRIGVFHPHSEITRLAGDCPNNGGSDLGLTRRA